MKGVKKLERLLFDFKSIFYLIVLCLCTERGGPICHKNNSWMVPDCKKDTKIEGKGGNENN